MYDHVAFSSILYKQDTRLSFSKGFGYGPVWGLEINQTDP